MITKSNYQKEFTELMSDYISCLKWFASLSIFVLTATLTINFFETPQTEKFILFRNLSIKFSLINIYVCLLMIFGIVVCKFYVFKYVKNFYRWCEVIISLTIIHAILFLIGFSSLLNVIKESNIINIDRILF